MYLIRLDDASDHMNTERWDRIERMLDENGVRPLVGVIPVNRDPMLLEFPGDPGFNLRDIKNIVDDTKQRLCSSFNISSILLNCVIFGLS